MMKRRFFWLVEADPSAEEMDGLLQQSGKVIDNLKQRILLESLQGKALTALEETFMEAQKSLPLASGSIDKEKWAQLEKEQRASGFSDIAAIKRALAGLDYPDIRAGRIMFGFLTGLLLFFAILYIKLHISYYPVTATAKAESNTSVMTNVREQNSTLRVRTEIAKLRIQLGSLDANGSWSGPSETYSRLAEQLSADTLSTHTIRALSTLGGAIELQRADIGKTELDALDRGLAEVLETPPADYLWTQGFGKWAEIAFWSFFGVLIGLMYYVSKRLKEGLFDGQDIATMIAEAVMAPIVTCVVFFLLDQTGITEISAYGDSFFAILGFAFLLGYAIRRAVGILDNLKTRLLPDP